MLDSLMAISPLDGRYGGKVKELREIFSEYGLVKRRVAVECAWLAALAANPSMPECPPLSNDEAAALAEIGAANTADYTAIAVLAVAVCGAVLVIRKKH